MRAYPMSGLSHRYQTYEQKYHRSMTCVLMFLYAGPENSVWSSVVSAEMDRHLSAKHQTHREDVASNYQDADITRSRFSCLCVLSDAPFSNTTPLQTVRCYHVNASMLL